MNEKNFRERAIELRGFINGYISASGSNMAPHTKAAVEFLNDFLGQAPGNLTAVREEQDAAFPPFSHLHQPAGKNPSTVDDLREPDGRVDRDSDVPIENNATASQFSPVERPCQPVAQSIKQTSEPRKGWSPEARAAASERMRARRAAGFLGRKKVGERSILPTNTQTTVSSDLEGERATEAGLPPRLPTTGDDHDSLTSGDWEDIQKSIIKGWSHEKIAGDYDVPVIALKRFIERQLEAAKERRAARSIPLGEAHAPASGAA